MSGSPRSAVVTQRGTSTQIPPRVPQTNRWRTKLLLAVALAVFVGLVYYAVSTSNVLPLLFL